MSLLMLDSLIMIVLLVLAPPSPLTRRMDKVICGKRGH